MTWWCSAQDTAWEWVWQPYIGVWLLVAAMLVGYAAALKRLGPAAADPPATRREVTSYLLGVLVLWIAADWPVGPLAAGYLVTPPGCGEIELDVHPAPAKRQMPLPAAVDEHANVVDPLPPLSLDQHRR